MADRPSKFLYDPEGLISNTQYGENMRLLFDEFNAAKSKLQAKPTWLHIEPSASCNLSCLMCSQANLKRAKNSNDEISKMIAELAPFLTLIDWSGGEPLMQSSFHNFIAAFDPLLNPYLSISLMTNGLLLNDDIIWSLSRFRSVTVCVSVDGTGKIYEHIRRGGKWAQLQFVVDKLAAVRENISNFYFNTAFTIQKDNVLALPDYLRWCIQNKIPSVFMAVMNFPQVLRPDIFHDVRIDAAGWLKSLEEAARLIKELDNITADILLPLTETPLAGESMLNNYCRQITQAIDTAVKYVHIPLRIPECLEPGQLSHVLFFADNSSDPCAYAYIKDEVDYYAYLPGEAAITAKFYATIYDISPIMESRVC
jgi:sulfatase maturation enzyme AslB (radical SAM superfamily)